MIPLQVRGVLSSPRTAAPNNVSAGLCLANYYRLTARAGGLSDVPHFRFLAPGEGVTAQRDYIPKSRRARKVSEDHPHSIFKTRCFGAPSTAEEPEGISPATFETGCVQRPIEEEQ